MNRTLDNMFYELFDLSKTFLLTAESTLPPFPYTLPTQDLFVHLLWQQLGASLHKLQILIVGVVSRCLLAYMTNT